MMFQARTHAFQLRNAGAAKLPFAFAVESRAEPGSRAPGPFALKPAEGVVPAGETVTVTVRFAPDEVVDCDRVIRCAFPGTALDDGFAPLEIPLGGKVNRPWCHFELPESEYLAGGGRPPGAGAVDGATRVVECVSLGSACATLGGSWCSTRRTSRTSLNGARRPSMDAAGGGVYVRHAPRRRRSRETVRDGVRVRAHV